MRRRSERGQGLVEFAVVLPIIIVTVFGILDLGRAVFAYNTLAQAARQASRVAIVNQDVADIRQAAIAAAPSLGLTAANVSVCFKESDTDERDCSSTTDNCAQADRVIGCLAIVGTQLSYTPMTPVIGSIVGSVPLGSTSIQPIEYVCPAAGVSSCP